jgi:prephenate dehydrogenase
MGISTLVIVGVGLVGGSVGLAARRRGAAGRVIGVDRDGGALERAIAAGAIDDACADLAAAAAVADFVMVCTPVDQVAAQVAHAAAECRPGTVLSDVGSTKAAIVGSLEGRLPAGVSFVGGHPLAGSEKNGPEHARADLFEGCVVVLTPTRATDPGAVAVVGGFWSALGGRVRLMEAGVHDRALALTSHLTHLVACALCGALPAELVELTATGFRDTTRLASGPPTVWGPILRANRAALLDALARFEVQLSRFRQALAADDAGALGALLQLGKTIRDGLDNQG